jgi:hypothetical protein
MSSYEYHQILQFLYFEGYADSYESAEHLVEQLTEEEYFELCERATRPTRLPKSRERDIGHDDWKDPDPDSRDWGERPEGAKKLRRRLTATVGTQRRQDIETGVRKEAHSFIAQYLHDEGYADTIESAELMVESISEQWVEEILESEDSNWNEVRKSASRRKPSAGPIRVGREPVLKSSDVTPPDPEVTERRKKRAKRLNFEVK